MEIAYPSASQAGLGMFYAHSRNDAGWRQGLAEHSRNVAALASDFASDFGARELAYYLGLWHDIGKFNPDFRAYLLACEADPHMRRHGPDHKAAGARYACDAGLWFLALLIQAHHGGLKTPADLQTWLHERSRDPAVAGALRRAEAVVQDLKPAHVLAIPSHIEGDARAAELFLRLLFSALVDADLLDTEAHFAPTKAGRRGTATTMAELWGRFERDQRGLVARRRPGRVHDARQAIYDACLDAAARPPGLFRLAVPTGGGKTRSGMAFALRHALCHGHRRVIVAVPYIGITEQTADTYRGIFGAPTGDGALPVVLEHHSGADVDGDGPATGASWARLAAENWDAPIIVTTTVQLFESLFSNRTGRGRKVHRLARSVIILDEAQSLPVHLLAPILDALRDLCAHYGTTVVISTATQPAFDEIPAFASVPATEIMPAPARFFADLKRVAYEWRTDRALDWDEIAAIVRSGRATLAVMNTKRDALALLDALDDPDALHLSTLLCGAHRRRVIGEVKRRLNAGEPCILVSTQVVEAGVDLDFPLVVRALGPLDGIVQAAGRCNREGRLGRGRVVVVRLRGGGMPQGAYRTATEVTGSLLGSGTLDPDNPAVARAYFRRLYRSVDTDRASIQACRGRFAYPEVADRFRMVDDETESVAIATYGSAAERDAVRGWLDQLRAGTPHARVVLRRLQPYLVSVRSREAERRRRRGWIGDVTAGVGEWLGRTSPGRGAGAGDEPADGVAEAFVV